MLGPKFVRYAFTVLISLPALLLAAGLALAAEPPGAAELRGLLSIDVPNVERLGELHRGTLAKMLALDQPAEKVLGDSKLFAQAAEASKKIYEVGGFQAVREAFKRGVITVEEGARIAAVRNEMLARACDRLALKHGSIGANNFSVAASVESDVELTLFARWHSPKFVSPPGGKEPTGEELTADFRRIFKELWGIDADAMEIAALAGEAAPDRRSFQDSSKLAVTFRKGFDPSTAGAEAYFLEGAYRRLPERRTHAARERLFTIHNGNSVQEAVDRREYHSTKGEVYRVVAPDVRPAYAFGAAAGNYHFFRYHAGDPLSFSKYVLRSLEDGVRVLLMKPGEIAVPWKDWKDVDFEARDRILSEIYPLRGKLDRGVIRRLLAKAVRIRESAASYESPEVKWEIWKEEAAKIYREKHQKDGLIPIEAREGLVREACADYEARCEELLVENCAAASKASGKDWKDVEALAGDLEKKKLPLQNVGEETLSKRLEEAFAARPAQRVALLAGEAAGCIDYPDLKVPALPELEPKGKVALKVPGGARVDLEKPIAVDGTAEETSGRFTKPFRWKWSFAGAGQAVAPAGETGPDLGFERILLGKEPKPPSGLRVKAEVRDSSHQEFEKSRLVGTAEIELPGSEAAEPVVADRWHLSEVVLEAPPASGKLEATSEQPHPVQPSEQPQPPQPERPAAAAPVAGRKPTSENAAASGAATVVGEAKIIRRGSKEPLPLRSGDAMGAGDSVSTGKDSYIILALPSTTSLALKPESSLDIEEWAAEGDGERAALALGRGEVELEVHNPAGGTSSVSVSTSAGKASATGTRFSVIARPEYAEVRVNEGQVRVEGKKVLRLEAPDRWTDVPGESLDVAAGTTVRIVKPEAKAPDVTDAAKPGGKAKPPAKTTAKPPGKPAVPQPPKPSGRRADPVLAGGKPADEVLASSDPWNDPRVRALMDEWLRLAEPAINARKGQRFRYEKWGRLVGPGLQVSGPVEVAAGVTRHQFLWEEAQSLDSIDHCTMREWVEKRLRQEPTDVCRGRWSRTPAKGWGAAAAGARPSGPGGKESGPPAPHSILAPSPIQPALGAGVPAPSPPALWLADLDLALAEASRSNRCILVFFTGGAAAAAKQLAELREDPEILEATATLVRAAVDGSRAGAKKYHGGVLPSVVILNSRGQVVLRVAVANLEEGEALERIKKLDWKNCDKPVRGGDAGAIGGRK